MRSPVIITGMPRAGIWLIAGAFDTAGAFGGDIDRKASSRNGETFENIDIRDRVERPLLEGLKCEARGLGQLPNVDRLKSLARSLNGGWAGLIDDIFTRQGRAASHRAEGARFVASPVACLLWPLWHSAYPDATWIFVQRPIKDIFESCRASGYLDGAHVRSNKSRRIRTEAELNELIAGYETCYDQMTEAGLSMYDIWPHEIFQGKLGVLMCIMEDYCGLTMSADVAEYLRPYLWKKGIHKFEERANA